MANIHSKGRVGDDGVTRYYDPNKHAWVTEKQIQEEQRANQIINLMNKAAYILVGCGFLWMVIVTFSN
jgi:hypothetical protein